MASLVEFESTFLYRFADDFIRLFLLDYTKQLLDRGQRQRRQGVLVE